MKIKDALGLLDAIVTLQASSLARDIKIGFMLALNKRTLEGLKEAFQTALNDAQADAAFAGFEADRLRLLGEAAEKDANGNPQVVNNNFVIADPNAVLPRIQQELEAKHPGVQAQMQDRMKKIEALSNEDHEVDLRTVPASAWPNPLPDDVPTEMVEHLLALTKLD